jgi:hypothetical protein
MEDAAAVNELRFKQWNGRYRYFLNGYLLFAQFAQIASIDVDQKCFAIIKR